MTITARDFATGAAMLELVASTAGLTLRDFVTGSAVGKLDAALDITPRDVLTGAWAAKLAGAGNGAGGGDAYGLINGSYANGVLTSTGALYDLTGDGVGDSPVTLARFAVDSLPKTVMVTVPPMHPANVSIGLVELNTDPRTTPPDLFINLDLTDALLAINGATTAPMATGDVIALTFDNDGTKDVFSVSINGAPATLTGEHNISLANPEILVTMVNPSAGDQLAITVGG